MKTTQPSDGLPPEDTSLPDPIMSDTFVLTGDGLTTDQGVERPEDPTFTLLLLNGLIFNEPLE